MATTHSVAFWNLENLFDAENSPHRSDKLKRTLGKAIRGWSEARLTRKIEQLASIIRMMNGGQGPDLLGVCEVENKPVLQRLVGALAPLSRSYAVAHADTEDQRGIDVAFIYDRTKFTVEAQFSHWVMRRTATRDLFQVNFRTTAGSLLVAVGNHWPSRLPEELLTASYRAIAGETLAYFHKRILEEHGKKTAVLAMGDFNDEPFNPSLVQHALCKRTPTKVSKARSPVLLNLMWPLMGEGSGTLFYNNSPFLFDQFLANKNLLTRASPLRVQADSASIFRAPAMTSKGSYPQPIRFGGLGKAVNRNGFSDHFPITLQLDEKD